MAKPMISADSHITEHPDTYRKHIEPALRERAPHVAHDDAGGDVYVTSSSRPRSRSACRCPSTS